MGGMRGSLAIHGVTGGAELAIGATVTDGTAGSVLFVGAGGVLAQDNDNFFWDNTTNRLGIGTKIPDAVYEVRGAGVDIGYVAKIRENTGNTCIFSIEGNADVHLFFQKVSGSRLQLYRPNAAANELRLFDSDIGDVWSWKGDNVAIGTTAFPGTGTKGLILGDGTALASMASNTAGLYANDVGGTVNLFGINEAGDVTQITGRTSAYTPSNVTTDRTYDANSTTIDEIADVLGTLIADLQTRGILG